MAYTSIHCTNDTDCGLLVKCRSAGPDEPAPLDKRPTGEDLHEPDSAKGEGRAEGHRSEVQWGGYGRRGGGIRECTRSGGLDHGQNVRLGTARAAGPLACMRTLEQSVLSPYNNMYGEVVL
jgi:hypothetical protein